MSKSNLSFFRHPRLSYGMDGYFQEQVEIQLRPQYFPDDSGASVTFDIRVPKEAVWMAGLDRRRRSVLTFRVTKLFPLAYAKKDSKLEITDDSKLYMRLIGKRISFLLVCRFGRYHFECPASIFMTATSLF